MHFGVIKFLCEIPLYFSALLQVIFGAEFVYSVLWFCQLKESIAGISPGPFSWMSPEGFAPCFFFLIWFRISFGRLFSFSTVVYWKYTASVILVKVLSMFLCLLIVSNRSFLWNCPVNLCLKFIKFFFKNFKKHVKAKLDNRITSNSHELVELIVKVIVQPKAI